MLVLGLWVALHIELPKEAPKTAPLNQLAA
nr:MAG TPA: hypothetical protein [Caudoviricetes sp.]